MMNLIRSPDPVYKGASSTPKQGGGGLLSQILCYLLGGGTPAYKGNGQLAPKACGSGVFPGAPIYQQPAVIADESDDQAPEQCDCHGDESVLRERNGTNADDPIQAMGPITIVLG